MDLKFWASFSLICILLHCCQICESRPRPNNCIGLFKKPGCPLSNIGITKRLFDEILKRTETDDNGDWETELRNEDEPELKEEQLFGERTPTNGWQGLDDDTQALLDTREKEVEDLRTKELKLLLIRAMLDDLENETLGDM